MSDIELFYNSITAIENGIYALTGISTLAFLTLLKIDWTLSKSWKKTQQHQQRLEQLHQPEPQKKSVRIKT